MEEIANCANDIKSFNVLQAIWKCNVKKEKQIEHLMGEKRPKAISVAPILVFRKDCHKGEMPSKKPHADIIRHQHSDTQ